MGCSTKQSLAVSACNDFGIFLFKCFYTGDMFAALLHAFIWLHHVIVRYNFIRIFRFYQKFGASLTSISQYTNLSLYWAYSIYDEISPCKWGNSWPGLDWIGWAGTGGTGGMVVGMGPPAGAGGAGGGGGGAISAAGGGAAVVLAATAETQSEMKPPQHSYIINL